MNIAQKQEKEMNEILIPSQAVDNVPLVLDTPKVKSEPQRDLFELDKEAQKVVQPKITQPKVVKKEKVKTPTKPKVHYQNQKEK